MWAAMWLSRVGLKKLGQFMLTYYVVGGVGYSLVQKWVAGRRDMVVLRLKWDDQIPFVSGFVWLYVLHYVLPLLVVLLLPRIRYYKDMLLSIALLFAVSFSIFLVFPVQMTRPASTGNGLSGRAVSYIYAIDNPPVNAFPSIHVAMSVLVALIARYNHRGIGNLFLLLALGIAISTLHVKQHWIADVAAGAMPGFAVCRLVYRRHRLENIASD
jgi:membrane-associated phospholipid phosphatase